VGTGGNVNRGGDRKTEARVEEGHRGLRGLCKVRKGQESDGEPEFAGEDRGENGKNLRKSQIQKK